MPLAAQKSSMLHHDDACDAMKKECMSCISSTITKNNWSGRKAADVLGIDEAKVSYNSNCHTHKFSLEYLMFLLDNVDYRFSVDKASEKLSFSNSPESDRVISATF